MSDTHVPADGNAEFAASGEIDAQLQEMQDNEGAETGAEGGGPGGPAAGQGGEGGEGQDGEGGEGQDGAQRDAAGKFVPLTALKEERTARQQLQRQLAERDRAHAEALARVNQRLELLFNPGALPPDKDNNPVDYLDHRLNEVTEAQRQILERDQQREQLQAQQAFVQQLASQVTAAEREFVKTAPDFIEAVQYVNNMRMQELQIYGMPEEQARVQVQRETQQAALQWAQQGMNPAETAYRVAQARGYKPKAAGGQGAQQTPQERIAAQQKGAAAARSLGGGGAPNAGKLTAEALANMSDEDFAKLSESQFRQAMGG